MLVTIIGKVIVFINLKGGVGKTTLAANLARCLGRLTTRKVLLVDIDPQCNLTSLLLGIEGALQLDRERSIYSVFNPSSLLGRSVSLFDVITPLDGVANVSLLSGHYDCIEFALEGGSQRTASAYEYFRVFMQRARKEFEYIIIDTNPSLSFGTICALNEADFIIAPLTFINKRIDEFSALGLILIKKLFAKKFPQLQNPRRLFFC